MAASSRIWRSALRERLKERRILVAAGVYDAFTALIAEQAGLEALYLTGAGIAYTRLGRPDIGLVTASEVSDTLASICDRVRVPVIVDADTGFGNALNVARTVRAFERSGAAAIQLEDQVTPKRCGHLDGKALVPPAEMLAKLRAALDSRSRALIVARTDAIAVEGLEAALDRAERYLEAGADVLFIEAPRSLEEMEAVTARFAGRVPLLANMVEGGKTPLVPAQALQALGFSIAIFPGAIARALGFAAREFYASLRQHGSTEPMRGRMLDFQGLNRLIGTPEMLELGRRYDKDQQG
jgi:2-methylisocitrate lyase-like PEP mutase family enzyme